MSASAVPATIHEMKNPAPREASMPIVAPGFGSLQSFELMQRAAKLLTNSTLVPAAYRAFDEKKGENPSALANCVVALNMSQRMGADALMVMQNLYIVEGRPSWSSQWIIAAINGCGRFSPLRFELKNIGDKEVEYDVTKWVNRERVTTKQKASIKNMECIAWAVESGTQIPQFSLDDLKKFGGLYGCCKHYGIPLVESPRVDIEMAVKEGWYGKSGSKWQTMPEVMLRYRTASFFGKLYAPELLMGLQTVEEAHDIIDINPDGSVAAVTPSVLRSRDAETARLVNPNSGTIEHVDLGTGEILDHKTHEQGEALDPQPQTEPRNVSPTLVDALSFVKQGDYDMAREIARSLDHEWVEHIEQAIAMRESKQKPDAATGTRSGRRNNIE